MKIRFFLRRESQKVESGKVKKWEGAKVWDLRLGRCAEDIRWGEVGTNIEDESSRLREVRIRGS